MYMNKNFFFMSGLPRSGSTMLKALLNQNPELNCSPISPVLELMYHNEQYFKTSEQSAGYPKPNIEKAIISSFLPQYYQDIDKPYIIDHCRAWVNNVERLQEYVDPSPKIICPVRDIKDILASFISLIHRNPDKINFVDEFLIDNNIEVNDETRCDHLMSPLGIVDQALWAFSEGYRKGHSKYFYLVEYEDLIKEPKKTIEGIYNFLEIPNYEHDFNNIVHTQKEKDEVWNLDGMHDVRKKLEKTSKPAEEIISSRILNKYTGLEFWRQKSYGKTFLL